MEVWSITEKKARLPLRSKRFGRTLECDICPIEHTLDGPHNSEPLTSASRDLPLPHLQLHASPLRWPENFAWFIYASRKTQNKSVAAGCIRLIVIKNPFSAVTASQRSPLQNEAICCTGNGSGTLYHAFNSLRAVIETSRGSRWASSTASTRVESITKKDDDGTLREFGCTENVRNC